MPYTPTVWTKGGNTRTAYTLGEETYFRFEGWTQGGVYTPPPYVINPALAEAIQDALQNFLAEGANVTLEYDDEEDRLVISATGGGGSSFDAEAARDAIMASISGAGLVNVAVDDVLDTIVITTAATANDTNANLRDRTTHTGEQPQSSITGLVTALGTKQPLHANLTSVAGLTLTNNTFLGVSGGALSLRTAAQVKTTLSLDLVNNTSDATKPVSTAQQAAIDAAKARGVHTGTQPSSTISDLTEVVQDIVSGFIASGTGITWTVDDAGNTATISATGGGGTWDAEQTRDSIGAALVGTGLIAVVPNDAGDSITISTTATANATDAALRDRGTHTGTQAASTISDLTEAVQDVVGAMFTDSAEVDVTYNDAGNVESIAITAIAISKVTGLQAALDSKSSLTYGGPSYMPSGLLNRFDPILSCYNQKATNLRKFNAGIVAGLARERTINIAALGDSMLVGTDGATVKQDSSVPWTLGKLLAKALSLPFAGGFTPCVVGSGVIGDRWAVNTGTVAITTELAVMAAGSAMTYTPLHAGTTVEMYYWGNSPAFTYQIDGAAAVTVTPTGANALEKTVAPAVADGFHTVKFNSASANTKVFGASVTRATGVTVQNFAYGGSTADWGAAGWVAGTDMVAHRAFLAKWGGTVDLGLISIGSNDMFQAGGDTAAHAAAGLSTMMSWLPATARIMTHVWEIDTASYDTDMTKFNAYGGLKYTAADTLDAPLVDFRARAGTPVSVPVADGLVAADGIHIKHGTGEEWARHLLRIVYPGPAIELAVQPAGGPSSHLPDQRVLAEYTP